MQHSAQLQGLIDGDAYVRTLGRPHPMFPPKVPTNNVQLLGFNNQLMTAWPTIPGAMFDASQVGERDVNYQTWNLYQFAGVI